MIGWRSAVAALGLTLAAGLSFSAPAQAGVYVGAGPHGVTIGWSHGYGFGHKHYHRYHRYHAPYRAKHHHHRHYKKHHRNYYYSGGHASGHYYKARNGYGCHPVNKRGRWRGHPARVGGTMCYNHHGKGYIVKGSRYLIRYR